MPTEPSKLPRPAPKKETNAPSDHTSQEGPTVLSPPRKIRRVMPNQERADGNTHTVEKSVDHVSDARMATNEHMPMSVDFSVFAAQPPSRPFINRYEVT